MTKNNNEHLTNFRPARMRFLRAAIRLILTLGIVAFLAPLAAQEPIHVDEAEAMQAVVSKTRPQFPPVARQLKLSGKAVVEATVDEAGSVTDVKPVSGNPLFTAAASDAVKKWKFKPFTSGGKPVRAIAKLSFVFTQ